MNTRDCFEKAYKIRHVLGKGGFGIVYAGVRNADGLDVAVKHIAKAKIKDWGQVRQQNSINPAFDLLKRIKLLKWKHLRNSTAKILMGKKC